MKKLLLFLSLFPSVLSHSQIEKRCQLTDTIFVSGCILDVPEIKLSTSVNLLTNERIVEESSLVLEEMVIFMNEHPSINLIIECNTDARGSDSSNIRISFNRSREIKAAMVKRGADSNRILCVGLGESEPAFVYLVNGVYYTDLQNPNEEAEIIRLKEEYINQFKVKGDKITYELLHQFNRRTAFRLVF